MKSNIPCPVCTSSQTEPFLCRPSVVVHQNLVIDDPRCAKQLNRGTLLLLCCRSCGFVFNAAFDPALLEYGSSYDNTQLNSPLFHAYTEELVRHLVHDRGVRDCSIVEVGCGNGAFLQRLIDFDGAGNSGWGFDPSYTGPDSAAGGRLQFVRRYYDTACADVPADIVVCRHVIEHVPRPVELLRSVRGALVHSPNARLFFETPCVEWVLKHRVVWDFFYEHCSYFSKSSLRTAFEQAGLRVVEVRHVFGSQYLWLEAAQGDASAPPQPTPGQAPALAQAFGEAEPRMVSEWHRTVEQLSGRGGVAVWGAGAKGVTFANLVDPGAARFACVVDINPRKQGRYLPGTGHAIVAPSALQERGVRTALVMNPNYRGEIAALLQREGLAVDAIDLMGMEAAASDPASYR
jgi:SAM-dependent methyltransferase